MNYNSLRGVCFVLCHVTIFLSQHSVWELTDPERPEKYIRNGVLCQSGTLIFFPQHLGMFLCSVLAFSLLCISNASSVPNLKASAASQTSGTVLGPVSQLHVANGFVAPDGFNRT